MPQTIRIILLSGRLSVGGEGIGEHQSLAQRIARFLSEVAQDSESVVEGAFISHQDIEEFSFQGKDHAVRVSGLSGPGHSIFRLKRHS